MRKFSERELAKKITSWLKLGTLGKAHLSEPEMEVFEKGIAAMISESDIFKKAKAFDQIDSFVKDFPNRKAYHVVGHVDIPAKGDFPARAITLYGQE